MTSARVLRAERFQLERMVRAGGGSQGAHEVVILRLLLPFILISTLTTFHQIESILSCGRVEVGPGAKPARL